jgi:hypothetical protein
MNYLCFNVKILNYINENGFFCLVCIFAILKVKKYFFGKNDLKRFLTLCPKDYFALARRHGLVVKGKD